MILLFAAFIKSLISLIILFICCDVFSSSFSWRFRFSRKSGESVRQSANSRGAKLPPFITILKYFFFSHTQRSQNKKFYHSMEFLLSSLTYTHFQLLFFYYLLFFILWYAIMIHNPRQRVPLCQFRTFQVF